MALIFITLLIMYTGFKSRVSLRKEIVTDIVIALCIISPLPKYSFLLSISIYFFFSFFFLLNGEKLGEISAFSLSRP